MQLEKRMLEVVGSVFCFDPGHQMMSCKSVFCPGFQKGRVPSENGTFSAVNGPTVKRAPLAR